MVQKKKYTKNLPAQKTVKISVENHKQLNLYKIQNDIKTMDGAIESLLKMYAEEGKDDGR